jgi:hypothetical protein
LILFTALSVFIQRGWVVSNGIISFASSGDAALTIPSQSIIKDMFAYAHELERIV